MLSCINIHFSFYKWLFLAGVPHEPTNLQHTTWKVSSIYNPRRPALVEIDNELLELV